MENGNQYVCSNCGQRCGYDGRMGDGPYLTCRCNTGENSYWVNDGHGGYMESIYGARPIHASEYNGGRNRK